MLKGCSGPLLEGYDLAMFDLDGVIYVGRHAIPGVAERLQRVRDNGGHLAFVTNNASRTPENIANRLVKLGIHAAPADVVTSAQAAARVVTQRFGPDAAVVLLGGAGLEAALAAEGVRITTEAGEASAVVSGYGPDVLWKDVMRAATLVRGGLPYIASNTDLTIPTDEGLAPGHGVLVAAIAGFAGVEPIVAGKPARPLMDETIRRVGGERPLMVGDRLDTDIEGAHAVGVDSLLVMTGVTHLAELVTATPELRPSYIAPDLEGLFEAHGVPDHQESQTRLGGWVATVHGQALEMAGTGSSADWWRVVAAASWAALDRSGSPVDVTNLQPPVASTPASEA